MFHTMFSRRLLHVACWSADRRKATLDVIFVNILEGVFRTLGNLGGDFHIGAVRLN